VHRKRDDTINLVEVDDTAWVDNLMHTLWSLVTEENVLSAPLMIHSENISIRISFMW